MTGADLALALGAGMLAAVNPCGFAMLPAYLGLLIGADQTTGRRAVLRALTSSGAMTAGFVVVFAVFGLVIAPLAAGVQQHLPWATTVVGVGLVLAGGWLLAGRSLPVLGVTLGRRRNRAPMTRTTGLLPMAGFGVVYALASLTCTIGPFLAIVVSSVRAGSLLTGFSLFVLYAVGMGLVVALAAVAVALGRSSVIRLLRGTDRWVGRVAGAIMVLVGAYVAYYGYWEVTVLRGGDPDDRVIAVSQRIQQGVVSLVSGAGPLVLGAALLAVVAVVVGLGLRRRSRPGVTERTR